MNALISGSNLAQGSVAFCFDSNLMGNRSWSSKEETQSRTNHSAGQPRILDLRRIARTKDSTRSLPFSSDLTVPLTILISILKLRQWSRPPKMSGQDEGKKG